MSRPPPMRPTGSDGRRADRAWCWSSGPGALNTVSALAEAYVSSSPVLAIASTIPTTYVGRGKGYLHEAKDLLPAFQAVTGFAARAQKVSSWRGPSAPPPRDVPGRLPGDPRRSPRCRPRCPTRTCGGRAGRPRSRGHGGGGEAAQSICPPCHVGGGRGAAVGGLRRASRSCRAPECPRGRPGSQQDY